MILFLGFYIDTTGYKIIDRFILPDDYKRIEVKEGSFQEFLRNLPLKKYGEKVRYYDGSFKYNEVYVSVIDLDIGNKDLLQCADALIRLRAEYFYENKEFGKIGFHLTNGFYVPFKKWSEGYRIKVKGNKTEWYYSGIKSDGRKNFNEYLEYIYSYAGTISLSKEMKKIKIEEIKIGDVFIHGGKPGHCVIVVDMAVNKRTGEKIFLLAQSYMPAQEIHILKSYDDISPWYKIKKEKYLFTPEWVFEFDSLKRF